MENTTFGSKSATIFHPILHTAMHSGTSLLYTVKKVTDFPVFSRDVTYQTPPGRELFPARESLVSDIPSGDGKTANLFLQCRTLCLYECNMYLSENETGRGKVLRCL
jgi:hypothetical protein